MTQQTDVIHLGEPSQIARDWWHQDQNRPPARRGNQKHRLRHRFLRRLQVFWLHQGLRHPPDGVSFILLVLQAPENLQRGPGRTIQTTRCWLLHDDQPQNTTPFLESLR